LPIAIPITATTLLRCSAMACSFIECLLPAYLLTGQEHGRTVLVGAIVGAAKGLILLCRVWGIGRMISSS
jgi:hypothetical protein